MTASAARSNEIRMRFNFGQEDVHFHKWSKRSFSTGAVRVCSTFIRICIRILYWDEEHRLQYGEKSGRCQTELSCNDVDNASRRRENPSSNPTLSQFTLIFLFSMPQIAYINITRVLANEQFPLWCVLIRDSSKRAYVERFVAKSRVLFTRCRNLGSRIQ